jgi:hypothetical protein
MSATDDLLDSWDSLPSYGNDQLMWKLEEVASDVDRLRDLILETKRDQMWSNTRIRQDVVSGVAIQGFLLLAILAMWNHVQWSWWYTAVLLVGLPLLTAYLYRQVAKQDEPSFPPVSLPPTDREIEIAEGRKLADERIARWHAKRREKEEPNP